LSVNVPTADETISTIRTHIAKFAKIIEDAKIPEQGLSA